MRTEKMLSLLYFTYFIQRNSISFQNNTVSFFHRNRDYTIIDVNVKLQGLDPIKPKLFNPMKNNTFGGLMLGADMITAGNMQGKYVDTDYKGWSLQSKEAVHKKSVELI
jgi:hypothetical protein